MGLIDCILVINSENQFKTSVLFSKFCLEGMYQNGRCDSAS